MADSMPGLAAVSCPHDDAPILIKRTEWPSGIESSYGHPPERRLTVDLVLANDEPNLSTTVSLSNRCG
jgi:hypothetical protein